MSPRPRIHVTPSMVARWLDVHEHTILRAIRAGSLPALRTGNGAGTRYRIFRKDLAAFLTDPGTGVHVVGGIETAEWGYRPFVGGTATVTPAGGGRLLELEATIRVDGENVRLVLSATLPSGGSTRACLAAMRTWSVTVFAASGGGSGTAEMSPRDQWRFREPSGRERAVRVKGTLHSNNGELHAEAAAAGVGIALEPDMIVMPYLRAGRLLPLLEAFQPPPMPIYAVYPSRKHLSAKVRVFIDFLAERLR